MTKPAKPTGAPNYGSIPHLPGSRMGPGDHHCHEGQARIATEKVRDKHDVVIVQEKLDGTNVGVARIGDEIYPIGRSGYPSDTSPYEQHHIFHRWAMENKDRFLSVLSDGERLVGEWLAQAHGTRYALSHEPFVALDIMRGSQRIPFFEFAARVHSFIIPHTWFPNGTASVEEAREYFGEYGKHGALDPIEGYVWRVERSGKVDFLVKYVRPDKVDGCYLPEITGKDAVWNWTYPN